MREVLLVTNYFYPGKKGGGPISSIKNLLEESMVCDVDLKLEVLTLGRDFGEDQPYEGLSFDVRSYYKKIPVTYLRNNYKVIRFLKENRSFDTIHLNSLFNFWFSIIFIFLSKLKLIKARKIIVSPRGELSDAALQFKRIKKFIFLRLVNSINLYKGVTWHVTSNEERDNVKNYFGVHKDFIYMIENCLPLKKDFHCKKKKQKSLSLIFLSRIHPKKNLLYALKVLSSLEIPYVFDVFGPIEDQEYFDECCSYARSLKHNSMINYKGELESEDVSKNLSNYDLLFFPTRGENFGHVSFESLLAGTPILISNKTPLLGLSEFSVGWDFELSEPSKFAEKIKYVYEMNQEEMNEMQDSIRTFIKDSTFFNSKFPYYLEMYCD